MLLNKYTVLIIFTSICCASAGQGRFSLGISGGSSYHFNSSYSSYYNGFAIRPEYNIGMNAGWVIGAKSRLGVEISYENMGIGRNWNLSDLNTSSKTVVQSNMHVDNWGIGFSYHYRLWQYKKLDVYGSSSVKAAFSLADREKTTLMDGTVNNSAYLDYNYRHNRAGVGLGLPLKFNLTGHWAITLLTEYTCYFRNFYAQSPGTLQSFRCNLGMDVRF